MIRFFLSSLSFLLVLPWQADGQGLPITQSFVFEEASFPQCHASTLVETPEGIVVAWFGGTHEKHEDVGIWVSRLENEEWTPPQEVANGMQHMDKRYPCWNPVLYYDDDLGTLLFFKVGPSPREWWGEWMSSPDLGKTWSKPVRLPEDILGPVKNKPIRLSNGKLLCGSSTEHDGWKVHVELYDPQIGTWLRRAVPSDSTLQVIQPSLIQHEDGRIQMLCRSRNNVVTNSWSEDDGMTWSSMEATTLPNPNSGIDGAIDPSGTIWLLYNPTTITKGEWGGSRWPLTLAKSTDGVDWQKVIDLEYEPGEYSYPAIVTSSDGTIHMTYTWKRQRIKYVRISPGS
ncbi:MAG: exo-alpha-sialidase [Saprospiraceae bacterium]|nr:exo-alpha-sialidase [Saprospiraceae bacterium]